MGRYLSNGVVTKIEIIKRQSDYWSKDFDISEEKDQILKQLNQYINVSDYDLTLYDNAIDLDLKKNIFNDNIHELIKEVNLLTDCSHYLFCNLWRDEYETIDTNTDTFNKENYPLELCLCEDDPERYCLRSKDGELDETWTDCYSNCWILWGESELSENLKIYLTFSTLWFDIDEIDSEDENYLLYILNNFKSKYYTSRLSKNLLFFIMN